MIISFSQFFVQLYRVSRWEVVCDKGIYTNNISKCYKSGLIFLRKPSLNIHHHNGGWDKNKPIKDQGKEVP